MHSLLYIAIVVLGLLYALAWHNRPSRTQYPAKPESYLPASKADGEDWAMFAIWGCVVLSFASLFVCSYIIWVKCHSDWPY